MGPDFPMNSPSDPGFSVDRPGVSTHSKPKGAKSPEFGYKLGDSYRDEDHGRSLVFDDNDSYVDISPHAFYFAPEDQGSISFGLRQQVVIPMATPPTKMFSLPLVMKTMHPLCE